MNLALILAQAIPTPADTPPTTPTVPTVTQTNLPDASLFDVFHSASPVVLITLLILIAFSVVCWAIIFYKFKQVKEAQNRSQKFWNQFAQVRSLQDLVNNGQIRSGPLYEIFSVGMQVASQLKKRSSGATTREILAQKLAQAREEEIYKLEQYTSFLATTASASPFIGLFGTVWGILTAFKSIGATGNASLQTVGPAISEALIATAIGLAAAIPAYIAYNYYLTKIRVLIKMMDLFSDDLVLRLDEEVVG